MDYYSAFEFKPTKGPVESYTLAKIFGDTLAKVERLTNPLGALHRACRPCTEAMSHQKLYSTTVDPGFTACIDYIYYQMPANSGYLSAFLGPADTRVQHLDYPNQHVPSDHLWIGAQFVLQGKSMQDEERTQKQSSTLS